MRLSRVAAVLLTLLALGCRNPTAPEATSFALKATESRAFPDFALTFLDVENDSRCPAQVMCVSAGNAQIAVTVSPPADQLILVAQQFLNTTTEPRQLDAPRGGTIRLDSLTPYPQTPDPIPQSQYVAWFTVVRR